MEEESALLETCPEGINWGQLADSARESYGMSLLWESSSLSTQQLRHPETTQPVGKRYLLVDDETVPGILLEHPHLLAWADRMGLGGRRPMLARPSLFTRWYGQAVTGDNLQEGPVAGRMGSDDQFALMHYLVKLLKPEPSDWHLEPTRNGFRSRVRVHGRLGAPVTHSRFMGQWLLNSVRGLAGLDPAGPSAAQDAAFDLSLPDRRSVSARLSIIPTRGGEAMTVRLLYPLKENTPGLSNLGFSGEQLHELHREYTCQDGLWLAAGPTGSGKSTTLAGLLGASINKGEKILSAEDPVERILKGVQQVEVTPATGLTFAVILKAFLRQAPDTILIGEIRDEETAAIALQAALSGHRVLASIHARNQAGIRERFRDLGQDPALVALAVRKVIHQRLVALLCGNCRREEELPEQLLDCARACDPPLPMVHYHAGGCLHCQDGYRGRRGLFSVSGMDPDWDVRGVFCDQAIQLWRAKAVDLNSITPYLPKPFRVCFSFPKRKDFANYTPAETP